MPFPLIPTPLYANVPLSPGVPVMLRAPGPLAYVAPALRLADALGLLEFFLGPRWGIFTESGAPFAIPDSVFSFDFRREFRLADYPIEKGGFASYDKVEIPYEPRVRFAVSIDKPGFLAAVDRALTSLDLFTVITPDFIYPSVSIHHYDYRRAAVQGAGVFLVDVWLTEVRIVNTTQFVNTKSPAGASKQSGGTVQARPPGDNSDVLLPGMTT